ncbi:hypothetical protein CRYPA_1681 [uncultured Candidatus Thioglobus sp.]|nr:hypothetical protein CRYPA_1681 [uncultured Candidatus Thioglobus sp.]
MKDGVLMIVHIYAKVSLSKLILHIHSLKPNNPYTKAF